METPALEPAVFCIYFFNWGEMHTHKICRPDHFQCSVQRRGNPTLIAELSPAGRTEVVSRCRSPAQGACHPAGCLSDYEHSEYPGYGDSRGIGFLGFYFTHHVPRFIPAVGCARMSHLFEAE